MDALLGDDYISLEFYVSQETIKFIVGVPDMYLDTFEKMIGSFYPGSLIEPIERLKFHNHDKKVSGAYLALTQESVYPIKTYEHVQIDPMDSILSACNKVGVHDVVSIQILAREL